MFVANLWQNLRYAIRALGRNPGFTFFAILSLALGIGANTAIFTLINALLLRDIPVRQPERLVRLSAIRQGTKIPFSYPMFREVERGQRVFSGMIGWGGEWTPNVEVSGVLSQDRVLAVTGTDHFDARFVCAAMFVPCFGARDEETAQKLSAAFKRADSNNVRTLRRNSKPDDSCWCAGNGWWLSTV